MTESHPYPFYLNLAIKLPTALHFSNPGPGFQYSASYSLIENYKSNYQRFIYYINIEKLKKTASFKFCRQNHQPFGEFLIWHYQLLEIAAAPFHQQRYEIQGAEMIP
ncbi:hypothetical protein BC936DRAFT_140385 [Jimgerdemannia flammicorona]|uniref:Uncharacterized protein n=1 Tax=Jimgerdemannia flammicorona TaxID=994334 RepID=A0A433DGU2_9FUNG|nr:hypothetical protein BC936DRAFT_140385 [Jimgerdemannia flammicorona]